MPWAWRLLRNEGIPVLPHQEHDPAVPRTAGAFLHTYPTPISSTSTLSARIRDLVYSFGNCVKFDNIRVKDV